MFTRTEPRLATLVATVLTCTVLLACAAFGWLTYRAMRTIIMQGFDRKLAAVSTATSAFVDGADHARILADGREDALYLHYVRPMRRIMDGTGLTYLYSQVLQPDGSITYVLDATRGKDHSNIGDRDQFPDVADVAGARAMLATGHVYLSALHVWKPWGVLKSAYAPIRNPGGDTSAMVGADINISIITTKTGKALAQVGGAGLLTVFAGCLVSFSLSRHLSASLAEVEEGALRVAAGEWGHQLPAQSIDELDRLAAGFNDMSAAMHQSLEELRAERGVLTENRQQTLLRLALEAMAEPGAPMHEADGSSPWPPSATTGHESLQTLRARCEVNALARRVHRSGGDEEEIRAWVQDHSQSYAGATASGQVG